MVIQLLFLDSDGIRVKDEWQFFITSNLAGNL